MANLNYYPLQKAIYEKLAANTALMAMVSGVFDHVPQGTLYPFITIGSITGSDISNLLKNCQDMQVAIHIWSREAGNKQAVTIMEAVHGVLHNGSISVTGQNMVMMNFSGSSVRLESDGWTYHGIMQLRIILSSN